MKSTKFYSHRSFSIFDVCLFWEWPSSINITCNCMNDGDRWCKIRTHAVALAHSHRDSEHR